MQAKEPVDLELVLAVGNSRSIDPEDAALRRDGYLKALVDPQVPRAIAGGAHMRIATERWIAIGGAIVFAPKRFEASPYAGARRDIAVSYRRAFVLTESILWLAGIRRGPRLCYRDHVIGGRGAFLIVADGFRSFANGIRTKLVRETGVPTLAAVHRPAMRLGAVRCWSCRGAHADGARRARARPAARGFYSSVMMSTRRGVSNERL